MLRSNYKVLKAEKIINDKMEVIGVTDVNMVKPTQIEVRPIPRSPSSIAGAEALVGETELK